VTLAPRLGFEPRKTSLGNPREVLLARHQLKSIVVFSVKDLAVTEEEATLSETLILNSATLPEFDTEVRL
jgi:hypothetical protein